MLKPAHGIQAPDAHDLPAGFEIPGLELLTQPGVLLDRINGYLPDATTQFEQCAIVNLRFKTPTSCLITYRLTATNQESGTVDDVYLYARGFGASEFESAVPQLDTTRWVESQWGPSVSVLPDAMAVLYWFPNDERLHGLRRVTVSKKLQRVFYDNFAEYPSDTWRISDRSIRLQTVRYKPERRIVMRCRFRAHRHADNEKHERFVYLGVYEDGRDQYLWDLLTTLKSLSAGDGSWTVPQPIAHVAEHGMIVNAEMPGVTMRTVFEQERQTGSEDIVRRVAHSLSDLHSIHIDSVPRQSNADVMVSLSETRDRLCRFVPGIADRCRAIHDQLCSRLMTLTTNVNAFVHGDLHPGQVILGEGPIGYIDFDRAHIGDPAEDLGNFRAQAWLNYSRERATDLLDRWIDAYCSKSAVVLTEDSLNTWTAVSLFQSALRPIGRLESDWRRAVDTTLAHTEAVLA